MLLGMTVVAMVSLIVESNAWDYPHWRGETETLGVDIGVVKKLRPLWPGSW